MKVTKKDILAKHGELFKLMLAFYGEIPYELQEALFLSRSLVLKLEQKSKQP